MEEVLFPILKKYFEAHDFTVKAEVNDIDIVVKKDDLVIAVEMKTTLNTTLMYQGIKREHITDYVYLAIPKPTDRILKSRLFKEKKTLIRRLELGLILVDLEQELVTILLDPKTYHHKKQKKQRKKLLKEFNQRQTAFNIGGSHKREIITAYRELALLALDFMLDEPKTTKALREYTQKPKVTRILQDNHYGWFERVERGVYQVTDVGVKAHKSYNEVIQKLRTIKQKSDTKNE
ncbi:MAG: DUF2161 family putative PD-(D/E)XK-type phosphodiesterase [Candidatus Izemoplasma sp.]|nr:DUF2161 family putative PD-(D/E)XK-type phosphodiesterase [Candidatus Izemoplasma sp.]